MKNFWPSEAGSQRRSATASLAARTMESVFLPRATDNDAEDLLDTNSVRERQARKDWNRVVRKDGFKSMIARDDPAVRGGLCGMGGALDACLAVLLRHKDSIKSAFGFYGIQGTETTEQCFAIGHNEWRAFVTDCGLAVPPTATPSLFPPAATTTYTIDDTSPSSSGPATRVPPLPLGGAATQIGTGSGANPSSNPAGATLKRQASMTGLLQQADAAFLAANYEPDKQSAEGQANLDRALMRFEFIEALIRLAVARHVKAGCKLGTVAAALEHMWTEEVLPGLPPQALHEPNAWRLGALYGDHRVNEVLTRHLEVVTAAFDLYRASNKDKRLRLADWLGLVNAAGLIGEATGLSQRDARICFARSLCVVVDEVGGTAAGTAAGGGRGGSGPPPGWLRSISADRCDLMEALARLAEAMQPPPREEVAVALRDVVGLHGLELQEELLRPWLAYYSLMPPTELAERNSRIHEAAEASAAAEAAALVAAERAAAAAAAAAAAGGRPGTAGTTTIRGETSPGSPPLQLMMPPNASDISSLGSTLTGYASPQLQPDSINGMGFVGGAGLQQPPTSSRQVSVAGSGGRRTLDGIASVIDGARPGTIDGGSGEAGGAAGGGAGGGGGDGRRLWWQLEALLEVLEGRLRERWEVSDNEQLVLKMQTVARSLVSGM